MTGNLNLRGSVSNGAPEVGDHLVPTSLYDTLEALNAIARTSEAIPLER